MNEELTEAMTLEVQRLIPCVESRVGLRSRWNGTLELVPNAEFMGKKPFSCSIQLRESLARQEARWRTILHEILHSVSAGYVQSDYNLLLGWEEGIVEQLQRLIRAGILAQLHVSVPEDVFASAERIHAYNHYITALEQMREFLGQEPQAFYIALLQTPIKDRAAVVFGMGNVLEPTQRTAFIKVFSLSNSVLRR